MGLVFNGVAVLLGTPIAGAILGDKRRWTSVVVFRDEGF
jgi:hypothetical protein